MDRLLLQQISTSTLSSAAKSKKPSGDKAALLGQDRNSNEQTREHDETDSQDDNTKTLEAKGYQLLDSGYTAKTYLIPTTNKALKLPPPPKMLPTLPRRKVSIRTPLHQFLTTKYPDLLRHIARVPTWAGARESRSWRYTSITGRDKQGKDLLTRIRGGHACGYPYSDWTGATIKGSKSNSWYRLTHQLWTPDRKERDEEGKKIDMNIDVKSEIFALGSAIYHMVGAKDL
ncbi:hypothetical protein BDZ45DRAFT_743073 [Acephala macrosclerotiorum]|nr:hypothetical protein BDZ45DRAFT_743073 [Acephala macrosclerotiorum]